MTVSETRTECPRCGSTSPSRALGGCFHLWHADPELRAEPSRGAPDFAEEYACELIDLIQDCDGDCYEKVMAVLHRYGALRQRDMQWLYSHCAAIGMTEKSDSQLQHEDIALFTIRLKSGHVVLLEALKHALPILISAIAFVDCKAVVAEVRAAILQAERT